MRLISGCCAIFLLLTGAFLFLLWLEQAEIDHQQRWIGSRQFDDYRVVARPGLAIMAIWPTLLGLAVGLDWLLTASMRRTGERTSRGGLYRLIAASQALILVGLLVPGAFICLVGASQLVYTMETQKTLARFERGRPGREAKASYEVLIEQLEDKDPAVRAQAAASLGELEVHLSQNAVPSLTELLRDQDPVAMAAAEALGKIGVYSDSAIPELKRLLETGSRQVSNPTSQPDPMRVCAAEALAHITRSGPWALQEALKHGNPDVRRCAAHGLGLLGEKSNRHAAAQHLKTALKDDDDRVRAAAREALDKIDPQEPVPEVIQELDDPDPNVRLRAARTLIPLGEDAKDAAPRLAKLITDPNPAVRVAAAHALVRADPQSALLVDALLVMLTAPDDAIRRYAAERLGEIGSDAQRAIPNLEFAMADPDEHVRARAATAVWKISGEPEAVIPVLVALLEAGDTTDGAQMAAIVTLRDMGPLARAAVPVLEAVRDHGRPRVQSYAESALKTIAPDMVPPSSVRPTVGGSGGRKPSVGRSGTR